MKLSIVIPAHNEERRLPQMLEAYASYFSQKYGQDAELIVVPNFCTDRTADVAREIGKRFPQIRVLDDPGRVGKGGAVITGVKASKGEWVGFVDADGATTPEEFDRLAHIARSSDGVIGSRWMKKSKVSVAQKGMRLLSSRLFNGLIRLLLGLRYADTQCGAKVFRADAWRAILPDIGITRFAFDVDVLFQLKRHGYSIAEEPTEWNDVDGTTVQFFNSSIDMFLAVVRMRLLYSPLRFVVPVYERFFSRIVEFLRKDALFCHAAFLFAASMVMNVCNIGYQMVMTRSLPKEEYALLATFLALFAIVVRPLGTLGTAFVRSVSLLVRDGRLGAVRRLILKWALLSGVPAILLSIVCIVFSKRLADFFHLDRVEPVFVSALALPVMFVAPLLSASLRGMQRFGFVSLVSSCNGVSRLILGAGFVLLVFPACGWALAGHVGAMYFAATISVLCLGFLLRGCGRDVSKLPSLRFYLLPCFFIQTCSAMLMNGDVVLMKHYLPEESEFAYAATLGRMVVFMVVSVISSMFPKVSSAGEFTQEQRRTYFRSVMYIAVLAFCSVAVCNLFPELLLRVLFGLESPSTHVINLTRAMSLIMAMGALMNINISLLLAQKRFMLAAVTIPSAILYAVGVHLYHLSAFNVLMWAGGCISLSLLVTLTGILRLKPSDETHVEST